MSQHTSEPWKLKTFDECQTVILGGNMLIATVSVGEGRPNGEANAQLLVTAPELLRALRHIRAIVSPNIIGQGECDRLDDAIANATGEKG